MEDPNVDIDHIRAALPPEEAVRVAVPALVGTLALTDRRLMVAVGSRVALDVPISGVRRVQLDVERGHPATLVVVPDDLRHQLQVLAIPVQALAATAEAVTFLGSKLDQGL